MVPVGRQGGNAGGDVGSSSLCAACSMVLKRPLLVVTFDMVSCLNFNGGGGAC